jgi:hypothetical protein
MEERHQQQETMRRENRRVQAMSWGKFTLPKGIQNLIGIISQDISVCTVHATGNIAEELVLNSWQWHSYPQHPHWLWVPASSRVGTGVLSLGIKWLGCDTDHSSPSNAEVKNVWSYTSTSLYISVAWCLMN